jgi:hypothetical protein
MVSTPCSKTKQKLTFILRLDLLHVLGARPEFCLRLLELSERVREVVEFLVNVHAR